MIYEKKEIKVEQIKSEDLLYDDSVEAWIEIRRIVIDANLVTLYCGHTFTHTKLSRKTGTKAMVLQPVRILQTQGENNE
jgi:hypothetical protein